MQYVTIPLFGFGSYLIYRNYNFIRTLILDYINKINPSQDKVKYELNEKFLIIHYNDKVIYLPRRKELESSQCDFNFYYLKEGKYIPLNHPTGIPFFISANDIGVESIIRIDNTEGDTVKFIGDEIPNYV